MSVLKVFKKIFSRIALTLLLILIQIAAIMALEIWLIIQWWPFAIEFELIGVVVFFLVINRKGSADLKLPWVIIVLALPLLGVLLYAFFANHGFSYSRTAPAIAPKADKTEENVAAGDDESIDTDLDDDEREPNTDLDDDDAALAVELGYDDSTVEDETPDTDLDDDEREPNTDVDDED